MIEGKGKKDPHKLKGVKTYGITAASAISGWD
jgi:hypothetical protein